MKSSYRKGILIFLLPIFIFTSSTLFFSYLSQSDSLVKNQRGDRKIFNSLNIAKVNYVEENLRIDSKKLALIKTSETKRLVSNTGKNLFNLTFGKEKKYKISDQSFPLYYYINLYSDLKEYNRKDDNVEIEIRNRGSEEKKIVNIDNAKNLFLDNNVKDNYITSIDYEKYKENVYITVISFPQKVADKYDPDIFTRSKVSIIRVNTSDYSNKIMYSKTFDEKEFSTEYHTNLFVGEGGIVLLNSSKNNKFETLLNLDGDVVYEGVKKNNKNSDDPVNFDNKYAEGYNLTKDYLMVTKKDEKLDKMVVCRYSLDKNGIKLVSKVNTDINLKSYEEFYSIDKSGKVKQLDSEKDIDKIRKGKNPYISVNNFPRIYYHSGYFIISNNISSIITSEGEDNKLNNIKNISKNHVMVYDIKNNKEVFSGDISENKFLNLDLLTLDTIEE